MTFTILLLVVVLCKSNSVKKNFEKFFYSKNLFFWSSEISEIFGIFELPDSLFSNASTEKSKGGMKNPRVARVVAFHRSIRSKKN